MAGSLILLLSPAAHSFRRSIMEGLPATNNAILVSTGTSVATSSVTVQNLVIQQLPANQCVQTSTGGLVTTSGAQCGPGSGGGVVSGTGSVVVTLNQVVVTSPTTNINFSNNFTASLTGSATASVDLAFTPVKVQSSLQSGATFFTSSGTVQGPLSVVANASPPGHYATIENPVLYAFYNAAINPTPAGSQSETIYADFLSTGSNVSPSGDGVAIHGRAREVSTANGQLIGVMGEVFGQNNAPAYTGLWGTAGWASDLTQGTTSEIEALRLIVQITNLAGNVTRSTGTLKVLYIPDFTDGHGAPNQSWPIYVAAPYPSFFNGFIGIGQKLPVSPLFVDVSTNTQYGIVMASVPVGNVTDVGPGNYTFTVTNPGVVFDRGENITGPSTIVTSQNPNGTPDTLSITYNTNSGVSTRATGLRSNIIQNSATAGALSVAVAVQGVATDLSSSNGTLEGLDGRGTGAGLAPQYAGAVVHGNWQSDLVGGTTSTIAGLQITDSITLGDGVTALSTGTLKQLFISDPTGSGASGQSWALYSTSRFPSYFNNFIGIGDKAPTASLSVAASTNTTYSIVAGSVPFFSGSLPSANYNFTVTNDGQVTSKGLTTNSLTINGTGTSVGGTWTAQEGTPPAGVANSDVLYADSTRHAFSVINNNGASSAVAILGATQTWTASQIYQAPITATSSATLAGISSTAHLNVRSGPPSLSSCGSSPGITGTDNAGTITEGGGSPTGCIVTFANSWTNTPFCVAQTTSTVTTAAVTAINANQFTITTSVSIPSDTINYICVGRD